MKTLYLSLISFLFLASCQEDLTPAWLEIKTVNFTTNEPVEGPNSHDIVDAWVYIDNKEMGVWEIPFRMPVLQEGEHTLTVIPGIKISGQSSIRVTNNFYEAYTTTINLSKKETTTIVPTFGYKPTVNVIAKEDFEDTGVILNPDNTTDTTKFKIISKLDFPDIVKYGNNCGRLQVNESDTVARVITDLDLPIIQGKMYLEIDYLATNSFFIGILEETSSVNQIDQGPYAGAYRTDADEFEWKKIYFPLSDRTNLNAFANSFEFYIYVPLDTGNQAGEVYIDNVKIVYF
ncbi:MAG: hypothetical protein AB8B72_02520 [Crocinitomicaceae bacterium]